MTELPQWVKALVLPVRGQRKCVGRYTAYKEAQKLEMEDYVQVNASGPVLLNLKIQGDKAGDGMGTISQRPSHAFRFL